MGKKITKCTKCGRADRITKKYKGIRLCGPCHELVQKNLKWRIV